MSANTENIVDLIQQEITQPVYFRVVPAGEGRQTIEQIQFLTTQYLARITGLEARTIRDWVKRKLLPYHKPPGTGHYLFELNETLRFLMSQKGDGSE